MAKREVIPSLWRTGEVAPGAQLARSCRQTRRALALRTASQHLADVPCGRESAVGHRPTLPSLKLPEIRSASIEKLETWHCHNWDMTYVSRQDSHQQLQAAAIENAPASEWPLSEVDIPAVVAERLNRAVDVVNRKVDPSDPDWSSYRADGSLTRFSPEEISEYLRTTLYEALRQERKVLTSISAEAASAERAEVLRKYQAEKSLEVGRLRKAQEKQAQADRRAREDAHALIGVEERASEQARLKSERLAREAEPGYVAIAPKSMRQDSCPHCGVSGQYYRICGSCRRVR